MDDITLRDYRPGDAESLYALDVICFEPPYRFSRRSMRNLAEAASAITVLAEAGGELAGFCITHNEDTFGYVVTLDVAPAWRRHGIARRLMADIEARLRAAGATGMALHVYAGNPGAMAFYESIGFGRVGMVEGFYGRGLDALVYRKNW